MAPVTLPPSFYNSFWSPDYRTGLEVLFKNLEKGCLEDEDIAEFVESQIKGHHALATTLLAPPVSSSSNQTSSSLQHTILSLKGASSARGEAHKALANELEQKVLAGFNQWKDRHEERVRAAKDEMLTKIGVVGVWEKDVQKLASLRQTYLVKSRAADDSEDDAKFAPATTSPAQTSPVDTYTASPQKQNAGLRRSGTVADRINEKLRQASVSKSPPPAVPKSLTIEGKTLPPPPSPLRPATPVDRSPSSPTKEDAFIPPTDPHGKPTMHSDGPPVPVKPMSAPSSSSELLPQPILLSGLSLTAQGLKDLLQRFDAYLLTTPAPYSDASVSASQSYRSNLALASRQKGSILGTYEKTFSGEEAVQWLRENVEGFGGDWERCVDAANELYHMGHYSRIGVGRGFEAHYDTFFTLKIHPGQPSQTSIGSPLSPATSANIQSMLKSYLPASLSNSDEPAHIRLRRDATKADEAYREGVRSVEEKRLEMEERIERALRVWEKWERERLGVVKSVLKAYDEAVARLPARLHDLVSSTSLSVEAFNPDADLKALIEGNRTGPFRPQAHTYESVESDIPDVNFGIDLRRWSGELGWKGMLNAPQRPKGAIPEVLQALLTTLNEMYGSLPDEERRRSWIYEVPLVETHALRRLINNPRASVEDTTSQIKRFNTPVVAGVIKLYLLELNPPVLGWEGWEDAKAVYPSVGADLERDVTSAVTSVLDRLPGAQLYVLDAIVKHFRDLIDSTKSDEANEVYITKLALSVGRCILRPQFDTEITIGDRTPSLFLADLIQNYSSLFPPLVDKKKKELERVMPVRKRTALVDQRISRSQLGNADPHQLLEHQHALAHPARTDSPTPSSIGRASALGLGVPLREEPEGSEEQTHVEASVHASQPPAPVNTGKESERGPSPIPSQPVAAPPLHVEPDVEPSRSGAVTPNDDSVVSPTASILDSMELSGPPEDKPLANVLDASGLKRATSGEVSRLRGPRGARGPRPAPGRVPSHAASNSVSSGPTEEPFEPPQPAAETQISERSGGVGVSGDYAPKRGKGATSAGAFGHGPKGSVSQAIAQFENRS